MPHKPPAEVVHVVEPFVAAVIEPIFYSDATRSWASHRVASDQVLEKSASVHFLVRPLQHGCYSGKS